MAQRRQESECPDINSGSKDCECATVSATVSVTVSASVCVTVSECVGAGGISRTMTRVVYPHVERTKDL